MPPKIVYALSYGEGMSEFPMCGKFLYFLWGIPVYQFIDKILE